MNLSGHRGHVRNVRRVLLFPRPAPYWAHHCWPLFLQLPDYPFDFCAECIRASSRVRVMVTNVGINQSVDLRSSKLNNLTGAQLEFRDRSLYGVSFRRSAC